MALEGFMARARAEGSARWGDEFSADLQFMRRGRGVGSEQRRCSVGAVRMNERNTVTIAPKIGMEEENKLQFAYTLIFFEQTASSINAFVVQIYTSNF